MDFRHVALAFFMGAIVAAAIMSLPVFRRLDPWAMQKKIMVKSGQRTPITACLTKHSLTYMALVLEEAGETFALALQAICSKRARLKEDDLALLKVQRLLAQYPKALEGMSRDLRHALADLGDTAYIELSEAQAVELADGFTDMTVVVVGGAIASGIPGGPCFEEVGSSNLSKANPETGEIDVDPSGKWIKGSKYRPPDLHYVLHQEHRLPGQEY